MVRPLVKAFVDGGSRSKARVGRVAAAALAAGAWSAASRGSTTRSQKGRQRAPSTLTPHPFCCWLAAHSCSIGREVRGVGWLRRTEFPRRSSVPFTRDKVIVDARGAASPPQHSRLEPTSVPVTLTRTTSHPVGNQSEPDQNPAYDGKGSGRRDHSYARLSGPGQISVRLPGSVSAQWRVTKREIAR
jgi:hypothetical protein